MTSAGIFVMEICAGMFTVAACRYKLRAGATAGRNNIQTCRVCTGKMDSLYHIHFHCHSMHKHEQPNKLKISHSFIHCHAAHTYLQLVGKVYYWLHF